MKIFFHPKFLEEKGHAARVLFEDILGLKIDVATHSEKDTLVSFPNGKSLRIVDSFFSGLSSEKFNADEAPLPEKPFDLSHGGRPILALYGQSSLEKSENGFVLRSDLLASAFFMLSRWEERRSQAKFDAYGRFVGRSSYAFRNGVLDRPLVDEYALFLGALIEELSGEKPVSRKGTVIPTHDVDLPLRFYSRWVIFKNLVKSTLRFRFGEAILMLKGFLFPPSLWARDPYNSFSEIMDFSDSLKLKSIFFMMAGGDHSLDYHFAPGHPFLMNVYRRIQDRGHEIGLHPSFMSSESASLLEKEVKELGSLVGHEIRKSRQHFLKLDLKSSLDDLENAGIQDDYTFGYHDVEGFRIGTCHAVRAFSWLRGKTMAIRLHPLICMDGTLKSYRSLKDDEIVATVRSLATRAKSVGGDFIFLWHNNNFIGDRELYARIFRDLKDIYGL